jgi:hypothetical protein
MASRTKYQRHTNGKARVALAAFKRADAAATRTNKVWERVDKALARATAEWDRVFERCLRAGMTAEELYDLRESWGTVPRRRPIPL